MTLWKPEHKGLTPLLVKESLEHSNTMSLVLKQLKNGKRVIWLCNQNSNPIEHKSAGSFQRGERLLRDSLKEKQTCQLSLEEDGSFFKLLEVLRKQNLPMQLVTEDFYIVPIVACSLFWSESLSTFKLTFSNKYILTLHVIFFLSKILTFEKLKAYTFSAVLYFKNLSRYHLVTIKVVKVACE